MAGLLLEDVVRRPLTSAAVLLVGAVAVAGAAAAPMLARATEQLALTETLATTDVGARTVAVSSLPSSSQASALSVRVDAVTAAVSPPVRHEVFGPTAVSVSTTERVVARSATHDLRAVVGWYGDDGCARLGLTTGRCPAADGEIAVSSRDARASGLRLGDRVQTAASAGGASWTVVGEYTSTPTRAGFPTDDVASLPSGDAVVTADPVLTTVATLQSQVVATPLQITASRVLPATGVGLDDVPAVVATTRGVHAAASAAARGWVVTDPVERLLQDVDAQRHVVAVTVPVVGVQLVLIAWIGLAVLIRGISLARAPEWALGTLRGLSRRRVVTAALGGPAALLVLAAPLGLLLAAGATSLLAARLIGDAVPVEPWRWPVLLVVAAALVGSLLATAAAAWQGLTTPVASLLHRAAVPVAGRAQLAGETAIGAVAAVACYQVVAGGVLGSTGQSQLGLVAPALAAVAVGLVTARVVGIVLRRTTRGRPRRLATLIATRRLAHAPGVLRGAVVLVAGAALAASALNIAAVAGRNRELRAGQEVGAATVLAVTTRPGVDLVAAVDTADPSGRWAMAAVQTGAAGGAPLLAVDADRYAALAAVDPSWSTLPAVDVAAALHPPRAASMVVEGTVLRLDLADLAAGSPRYSGAGTLLPPDPGLGVGVRFSARLQSATGDVDVDLGAPTTTTAALAAPVPCVTGCRLMSLTVAADRPGTPFVAAYTVAALRTDTQPAATFAAALADGSRWRTPVYLGADPDNAPMSLATPSAAGLRVTATDLLGRSDGGPAVVVNDVPGVLPALVGSATATVDLAAVPGAFVQTGLDGQQIAVTAVGTSRALPRLGAGGVLVDLRYARLAADLSQLPRAGQVWLAAGAPSSLRATLEREGVEITGVETSSDRLAQLTSLAPARAVALAGWTSTVGLALAIVVAAAGLLLSHRTRLYELASMRAMGVAPGILRRAVTAEIVGLLGLAVLVGVATGLLTSNVTVPNLPFYGGGGGPPLDLAPAVPVAAVLTAAGLLAAVLLALASATGLVRLAVPSRLRENLR